MVCLGKLLHVLHLLLRVCVTHIAKPPARGCAAVFKALFSNSSIKTLQTTGDTGEPIAAPLTCM